MARPVSIAILAAVLLSSLRPYAQTPVPGERLLNAVKEPQNWMMYGADSSSHRHSGLTQITPQNVKTLVYAWAYQAPNTGSWQATPLVVDGIMYLTQRPNEVVALDAGSVKPAPRIGNALDTSFIGGIGSHHERFITLLAIDRLFTHQEIDAASSAA